MNPTPEQIAKLPKWAQERIHDLERERNESVKALNQHIDGQTPSPFYTDQAICTGEVPGAAFKRTYYQAGWHMNVVCAGVKLQIVLRDDRGIDLQWSAADCPSDEVAFIPASYQKAELVSREHLRFYKRPAVKTEIVEENK